MMSIKLIINHSIDGIDFCNPIHITFSVCQTKIIFGQCFSYCIFQVLKTTLREQFLSQVCN